MTDLRWKTLEASSKVICAHEPMPMTTRKSIFLAGPTPRDQSTPSWRPRAVRLLHELGFDGHIFVPEDRSGTFSGDYTGQVEWEREALNMADVIVFWVPRDMATMPALTTNIEWGMWQDSGKAVFGAPPEASSMRYLRWQAQQLKVPAFETLEATLEKSVEILGDGAAREGGAARVPLHIWKHPTFQGWYEAQTAAGNRLDGARVLWTFRVGPERKKVFSWAVHVDVHIASEGRNKVNEFVFGRVDIAAVVLYHLPPLKAYGSEETTRREDAKVVLVREFRSPARTKDGFIVELPAGSIEKLDPKSAALKELEEETGVILSPDSLRPIGTRQVAGTLSAHTSVVFAAHINEEQLAQIEATKDEVRGVEVDSERTTVVVDTFKNLLKGAHDVDWSTMGMITTAVLTEYF